ncbi:MAG TPA: hypothetical protein VN885_07490 [Candidatus Acidoferrales bacterium]|nr:hypothetical protein [Candidatus Acidoferrales bacterium]
MLLMLKGILVPGADADLYTIETKELKGFQLGDSARRPRQIAIELYDNDGKIELIFGQSTSAPVPLITRAELNFVIQSIRRTSASAASLAK